jgi:hypothetical protein
MKTENSMETKKIIDYKVVKCYYQSEQDFEEFEKEVLKQIKNGYFPIGGATTYKSQLLQAMVKYEEMRN